MYRSVYIQPMGKPWGFLEIDRSAIAGTVAIHIVAFSLLTIWTPRPLPETPRQIPIELVDFPLIVEADEIEVIEPVIRPEPVVPEEPESDVTDEVADATPAAEPETLTEEDAPEDASQKSRVEVPANVPAEPVQAPRPLPGVSLAEAAPLRDGLKENVQTTVQDDTPPEFVYEYDPFAETAPTLFARVSLAVNCSRVNRDTRPEFCPNYDDEDVYLAAIGAARPSAWEQASYDPVLDLANAQSALGRFTARQSKHRPNGRSEVPGVDFHPVKILDEDCVATPFGFGGPDGPNGTVTPGVPDSKAVHCR